MFRFTSKPSRNNKRPRFEQVEDRYLLAADGFVEPPVAEAAGEPGDAVAIRLETTDLTGAPISKVDSGNDFLLKVYVQDTQDEADIYGVFAAYLDVTYDAQLGQVAAPPEFGALYPNGHEVHTSVDGLIDDTGAFTAESRLDQEEITLFTIRMTAEAAGLLSFQSDPADTPPITYILTFAEPDAIPADDVSYGSTSITIVDDNPETLDGDLDRDLDVDFADFLLFSARFGESGGDTGGADIDGDNEVGFSDFLLLSQNFGKSINVG